MTTIIVMKDDDDRHGEGGHAVVEHKRLPASDSASRRKVPGRLIRELADAGPKRSLGHSMTGSMQSASHLLAPPVTAPAGYRGRTR